MTFFAPLEIHSIPKDPTPEYKSNILELSITALIKFECFKTLKILSLTQFDIHKEAFIISDKEGIQEACWYNIYYPKFKATIHLSYKVIDNNLNEMIEDSRTLVYKHTVKASDIQEFPVLNDSLDVYGLVYELEGEAASLMQFYLTDSVNHFMRGALYFNVVPNHDSLAPISAYIKHDIKELVNSFDWK